MRLNLCAAFVCITFLTASPTLPQALAKSQIPTRHPAAEKETRSKFEPYRKKIQAMAFLLLNGVEYDFDVEVRLDFRHGSSGMGFSDGVCFLNVSAKQMMEDDIKTEAGLAGVLAHELGHCFQYKGKIIFRDPKASPSRPRVFGFAPIRVLEKEVDAERRGAELMAKNPFYTIRDIRIIIKSFLEQAKARKRRSERKIREFQYRLDVLLDKELLLKSTGKNGAMYVIFTPQGFRDFRRLLTEEIEK